jgi:two-component system capsular synthesis response regulator RcsB
MALLNRSPIRVMQLDDHPVVRHGCSASLGQEADILIVGSFATSRELMNALRSEAVDLLLIDYSLGPGDIDGVNLIRALRIRFPSCAILVSSAHYNPATVSLALRAGAHGFIGKTQAMSELAKAIRAVMANRRYIEPLMAERLNIGQVPAASASTIETESPLTRHASLTPREREVLRCFLDGMSISQIAQKFSRNINTISTQKQAALRKLGVQSDNELFKINRSIGEL